jgi:hypothetical protein
MATKMGNNQGGRKSPTEVILPGKRRQSSIGFSISCVSPACAEGTPRASLIDCFSESATPQEKT